tara:strand:- start:699 stop:989 length:291 start_codon:yes stop_codon:yes gene_type:complete
MDIEFYEKMAKFQTQKIVKSLIKQYKIDDYLIIHRYGKLYPGENIVLILAASKHRKESFIFVEKIIKWLKFKITFWKKENFSNHSKWVQSENLLDR